MEICKPNKCTGCFACVNACASKCITMHLDKYGEMHPVIDEEKCKHCNLCINACPNNREVTYRYPQKCYASWITDTLKRKECASGGLGTIFSEYVINHCKGVVFGTKYNDDLLPITTSCIDVQGLEEFKGSKYVQSVVGEDTFKRIKSFLNDNRVVLYIGTPCQIAGLYSFLRKDYDNLITVDLICHGVSPTEYFIQEIKYLKKHYIPHKLTNVRFRGNDGNNYCLSLWNKQKLIYGGKNYCSPYLMGFLWGTSLRENCYTCNYARPERVSDITIGDFIGLGKQIPFEYKASNTSSVFINTDKGERFYEKVCKDVACLKSVERDYKERLEYAPSLLEPFQRDVQNAEFRELYSKEGFPIAIRKTLNKRLKKQRWIIFQNRYLKRYFQNAPKKLFKIFLSIKK